MMFFGLLFSWKGTVYRLRKKYDRIREKADKLDDQRKKMSVLSILDQIETTLVMLEEQQIRRFDRQRFIGAVKSSLEKAKAILDGKIIINEQRYSQTN